MAKKVQPVSSKQVQASAKPAQVPAHDHNPFRAATAKPTKPTKPPTTSEQLTQRARTASGLPDFTLGGQRVEKSVQRGKKQHVEAPEPTKPLQPKRRGRREGLTTPSASSSSDAFRSSTPPTAPTGYSSLYGVPSLSNYTSTGQAASNPAPKNKIIPALRAAGQRRMDRGEARSLDQGTALEIVSKLVGKNTTIQDIEQEKKSNTQTLFASPTELVTLYELAMRMVESHQFYTRTAP